MHNNHILIFSETSSALEEDSKDTTECNSFDALASNELQDASTELRSKFRFTILSFIQHDMTHIMSRLCDEQ